MTRLRTALLVAAATALALPAAAPAATTAVRDYAELSYTLVGSDGRAYHVAIAAYGVEELDGHPPLVAVRAIWCSGRPRTCLTVLDTRFRVPASAVDVASDLSEARLATTLGGEPLVVTWTATQAEPVPPGLQVWDTPTVRVGPQRGARAVVTAFGARCPAESAVVSREVTVSSGDVHALRPGKVPPALSGEPAPRCRPDRADRAVRADRG